MRKLLITLTLPLLALLGVTGCEAPADEPTAVQPAESGGKDSKDGKSSEPKTTDVPIKLVARRAKADASVLSSGGALSCVRVTVTNQSKKNVEVNPLYFSITDTSGTKHDVGEALAEYEGQIPTTTLAPGENAKGLVCGKGRFTPKQVAMTNPLFSEAARAEVG
ncbi:MAG: DUF4352 domain-containing protein [Sphaerobacter sp.]|nr:DUF4352 domain-containing protein [Sphaerobacter sp.]